LLHGHAGQFIIIDYQALHWLRGVEVQNGKPQNKQNAGQCPANLSYYLIPITGNAFCLMASLKAGNYFARFKNGKDSAEVPFTVRADPNYKITQQDYEQQNIFLETVINKFNETQKAIKDIRALRTQINSFITLQGKDVPKEIKQMADSINKKLTSIEETLYQTKAKSGQDVLNYPIKLNDKLSGVFNAANSGNFAPSKQSREGAVLHQINKHHIFHTIYTIFNQQLSSC
jgi:hypothetical protein